jgi:hypothetical protein
MRALGIFAVAVGFAISMAPVASASPAGYLEHVQLHIPDISAQTLMDEGYKVCRYLGAGRASSDAIPMVVQDLGVSVAAAYDLIPAAIEELDC